MQSILSANTTIQGSYCPAKTIAQVSNYLSRGYSPTPVAPRGKAPLLAGWTKKRLAETELAFHFGAEPKNIGVVLGASSNDLVDIDIDDDFALALAPQFLPKTSMIFGRQSRPRSHWLFRAHGTKSKRFLDQTQATIIELRGEGLQTVFPGSVHASGEEITFDEDGEPAEVEREVLELACTKICIATLLRRAWNAGSRHALALSAAGFFAEIGWKQKEVENLISAVAACAEDGEAEDRRNCVRTTYLKLELGEPVSGLSTLSTYLDSKTIQRLTTWAKAAVEAELSASISPGAMATMDISTDARAAEMFVQVFRNKLIYCDGSNEWFRRDSQLYRPCSPVQVQGVATKFVRDIATQIAGRLPGAPSHIRALESCNRINNMVQLSRSPLSKDWSEIDRGRNTVGLGDGSVYDLERMQVMDACATVVTKSLSASLDHSASCPNWIKFLNRIFANDQEVIDFIQRAVGYTLSGEVSEQCLFLLIGTGANGKSTFLSTLHHLLGDYAATIPMHTLMLQRNGGEQTNDLAMLPGKRFVAATEGEPGQHLAESRIKLVTGDDRISCRRLYQDFFEFAPQFKLWIATNNLPKISGVDEAIWRRIRVIRFPVTIPAEERDPDLGYILQSELPGILNWALEGHRQWKQMRLAPPDKVLQATGEYQLENDTVEQFIKACCDESKQAKATAKELHERYARWCEQSGYDPMSKIVFGKTLSLKGYTKHAMSTGSAWKGLMLKPDTNGYGALENLMHPVAKQRV